MLNRFSDLCPSHAVDADAALLCLTLQAARDNARDLSRRFNAVTGRDISVLSSFESPAPATNKTKFDPVN